MFSTLRNTLLSATALAAGTFLAFAAPAHAGADVSFSQEGFGLSKIIVISEDGQTWTTIKEKGLVFNTKIGLGKTDHLVQKYKIRQPGQPGNDFSENENSYLYIKRFFNNFPIRHDVTIPVMASTKHFTALEKQNILNACNAKLNTGQGIHQTHTMFGGAVLKLVAWFIDEGLTQAVKYDKSKSFTTPIECQGVRKLPGGLVAKEPKDLKVRSIKLFRSTYSHAFTKPNPATKCNKLRVLVRLKTNKKGPVKFKLWSKIGDQPMMSKVVDAWSGFSGPGEFKAEYKEWISISKTSFVQLKAEEMVNSINMSTPWKTIMLKCTDSTGNGYADVPNPDSDQPKPTPLKVTGELTLADKANAPKDKPRLGAAVFKIWATKPGSTSYKLTCSGGRQWTGTLPTYKKGPKKYQAVGLRNFQIAKTEQIGCALRSTSMPKNNVIALATKLFKLVKRNPNVTGAGDLTNGNKPQQRKPRRPRRDLTAYPKISCAFGKVARGKCYCPRGRVKVHAGRNAWRCIKRTVRPGGFKTSTPQRRKVRNQSRRRVGTARTQIRHNRRQRRSIR